MSQHTVGVSPTSSYATAFAVVQREDIVRDDCALIGRRDMARGTVAPSDRLCVSSFAWRAAGAHARRVRERGALLHAGVPGDIGWPLCECAGERMLGGAAREAPSRKAVP